MNPNLSFITNEENQSLKERFSALIKDTSFKVKVEALEREIDKLVCKLYGLTDEEIKIVEGETR